MIPFISTRHHAAIVAMQEQTIDRLTVELTSMTARYHQLRLQGFSEPKPQPAPTPTPAPDPVGDAIASVAGSNRALSSQMWNAVSLDRAMGLPDDEIVQRIYQGTPMADRVSL